MPTTATSTGAALRRGLREAPLHVLLVVGGVLMLFPFVWMLLTSVKGVPQVLQHPFSVLPEPWKLENYPEALRSLPFARAYANSTYIALLTVAGTLVTAGMAAYAFARLDFPGSRLLFVLFLATQMIPRQVTLVPLYIMLAKVGWIDTHLALIVPAAMVNPFAVFLLRQFIRAVPVELEEAAMLDGANRWTIFWRIIMPTIRPGLGALGIVTALDSWNAFLYPLVFLNTKELFTVPLLLAQFKGQYGGFDYGLVMAASAISVVPMLVAYLIGQRWILRSVASSGFGGR